MGQFLLNEGAAPSTPASGYVSIYAKTDGIIYTKDDAGTERSGVISTTASQKLPDIDVTQAAGALTVALNTAIYQDYRSTTLTDGTPDTILADPVDLVIPDGATLGATSGAVTRMALAAVYTGATTVFAVGNQSGLSLGESGLMSTTALTTGSDTTGTWYSLAAQTSKPFKIIGYFDAVNTAGSWGNPSLVQGSGGNAQPLKLVQSLRYETGEVATGATAIPNDDTIPQITEGAQFLSLAITPSSAGSMLEVTVLAFAAVPNSAVHLITALFNGATDAVAVGMDRIDDANDTQPQSITYRQIAGTTSPITFTVRIGAPAANTVTLNGQAGSRLMGGKLLSSITIKEYN